MGWGYFISCIYFVKDELSLFVYYGHAKKAEK